LGQAEAPDRAGDFDDQAGLDLELCGIWQPKVQEYIPGACFGGSHPPIVSENGEEFRLLRNIAKMV
jgi:hypothetical protein